MRHGQQGAAHEVVQARARAGELQRHGAQQQPRAPRAPRHQHAARGPHAARQHAAQAWPVARTADYYALAWVGGGDVQ